MIHIIVHNFIADFQKGGDFLKSYWAKWSRKQVAFFHIQSVKGGKAQPLQVQTAFVIFKTLGLIRLSHEPQKWKIPKLSCVNCMTIQLTVKAWSQELGWLALPSWLLSSTSRGAAQRRHFLYCDWKQNASWALCYSLFCFSLGSFAGPVTKHHCLENFHLGSQHHNTGILAKWAGLVFM